ncbi:TlpA disulfide reductase family protein [Novosphingobium sp. Fuku2-ISO-50]|uniref:TlpA family protein disulfide reductase n=1 Tax=Novosphingobium sp. Fuku2-ISO-50 TaxID=1739114 RepID=UPI0009E7DFF9|nr:TlpA disulfide reductase family protein [Novosphingobium sp. Fuku2-ISO-50]
MRILSIAASLLLALPTVALAAGPKVGQMAPNAQFETIKHERFDLASLRGQVVVINFWATWCGPCRQELPLLDSYYRAQKQHGLVVLAATTEDSVREYDLRKLFAALAITPLHRLRGPYAPMQAVPTNFVIDRDGVLRYAKAGAFTLDELNDLLVPLLRATPAAATTTAAGFGAAGSRPAAVIGKSSKLSR